MGCVRGDGITGQVVEKKRLLRHGHSKQVRFYGGSAWAVFSIILYSPSFCKREHLKIFPFAKIVVFIQRRCSRFGKKFKSLTRLVCE